MFHDPTSYHALVGSHPRHSILDVSDPPVPQGDHQVSLGQDLGVVRDGDESALLEELFENLFAMGMVPVLAWIGDAAGREEQVRCAARVAEQNAGYSLLGFRVVVAPGPPVD